MGWWVLDRFAYDQGFDSFERDGKALVVEGTVDGQTVRLIKPRTYMNRSGQALTTLWKLDDFDVTRDLLVVTDDVNLDVGRIRMRPEGGAGGHNGLQSVAGALGSSDFARLRIGVGARPSDVDLSDWVLSPMPQEDEDVVVGLLPDLSGAIALWVTEGVEPTMNRYNQ